VSPAEPELPAKRLLSAIVRGMALAAQGMGMAFIFLLTASTTLQPIWPYFCFHFPARVSLSVTLGSSGPAACVMLTASPHVSQAWQGGIAVTALLVCCQSVRQAGKRVGRRLEHDRGCPRYQDFTLTWTTDRSINHLSAHGEPWPRLTNHDIAEFQLHTSIQHLLLLLTFSPVPASRTLCRKKR
jgi:hypothetical protein